MACVNLLCRKHRVVWVGRQGKELANLGFQASWNNYFGPHGPAEGVTPLASAMLPPVE